MPTPNERLRRERQLRGWSQVHLAEKIGVPDYYISRWERGDVLPSPYYQQKLCDIFGKTAEELGMLQTAGTSPLNRTQKMEDSPLTAPESSSPPVEQLPSQTPPPLQLPLTPLPLSVSAPPLPTPTPKRPPRRRTPLVLFTLVLVMLISIGLGIFLLPLRTSPPKTNPIVGHLYFLSSGQISTTSSQGITDGVQLDLRLSQAPSAGKSYYAWLLPDEEKTENPVVLLGKVMVNGGAGHLFYSDPQHTNLLSITSRLLITEEDATVLPLAPSSVSSDWRYLAQIPHTRPPGEQYGLLDHLRHLLAADPTLNAHSLPGGIAIWLNRNTQKIYEWSLSARDDWQADSTANLGLLRRQLIRVLEYLDGIPYVQQDLPSTTPSSILVDPHAGSVGILQVAPQQDPPGFLHHMVLHLMGLSTSPGSSSSLREQAAQITTTTNTVNGWLEQVREDARQLAAMTDQQLQQQQALTLLNDMAMNANFALNGKSNQVNGNTQGGVQWIYLHIQLLATMDIMPYQEQK